MPLCERPDSLLACANTLWSKWKADVAGLRTPRVVDGWVPVAVEGTTGSHGGRAEEYVRKCRDQPSPRCRHGGPPMSTSRPSDMPWPSRYEPTSRAVELMASWLDSPDGKPDLLLDTLRRHVEGHPSQDR